MATFRQRSTYFEDGFGRASVLFVMADSYDALFETVGTKTTGVFEVGSVKEDLDISEGVLAQDELTFDVIESAAVTTDDADAIDFFKAGQDPANKRFVALFLNASDLPTAPEITKAVFIGQMVPEQKGTDVKHHGGLWSTAINALRDWQARAATFMDEVINDISLRDLIYGNEDELVTGIDTTWETANVADRLGWHKSATGDPYGAREARFSQLCSLNALLRVLADNLQQTLIDKGLGTYSITFPDMTFDWTVSPARYQIVDYGSGGAPAWPSRHVQQTMRNPADRDPFVVKPADQVTLGLGDTTAPDNQIWFSYRMVKPVGKSEQQHSFLRCRTFTELLYGLASSFGCFVRFVQPSEGSIEIHFVARKDMVKPPIYLRDIADADINLSVAGAEDAATPQRGIACRYARDGHDYFYYDNNESTNGGPQPSALMNEVGDGDIALMTVSPTLVYFWLVEDARRFSYYGNLPFNGVFYIGSSIEDYESRPDKGQPGLHTAIYVRTVVNGENVSPDTETIYLPAALVHAKVDGLDMTFKSLTEYVNTITARDGQFFTAEYNLKVPYLNGFSPNADGSSSGWEHLQLGSTVILQEDGVDKEFVVSGIERSPADVETNIRLQLISRFAFSTPGDLVAVTAAEPTIVRPFLGDPTRVTDAGSRTYIADESITMGDAVASAWDGVDYRVRRMVAHSADYDAFIGIAMADAAYDEDVLVQSSGRVSVPTYAFAPGDPVYVRTATHPASNVSQDLLTGKTLTEDMIVNIGTADTETSFVLDLFSQIIFEA
jgi:hypothetical protein